MRDFDNFEQSPWFLNITIFAQCLLFSNSSLKGAAILPVLVREEPGWFSPQE